MKDLALRRNRKGALVRPYTLVWFEGKTAEARRRRRELRVAAVDANQALVALQAILLRRSRLVFVARTSLISNEAGEVWDAVQHAPVDQISAVALRNAYNDIDRLAGDV